MNKKIVIGSIIGIGILAVLSIGLGSYKSSEGVAQSQNNQNDQSRVTNRSYPSESSVAEKIEVFLFHATQRCPTCIRIGQLSKATVEEKFPEQLKSGKIDFREINIDLPENKTLAEKFQAGGSALYINAIKNGVDNIEQDVKVWSLVGNTTEFKNYLENKLNNILGK
jgi:ATP-dependent protease HslVU (ClpYQ) ATPase subunit